MNDEKVNDEKVRTGQADGKLDEAEFKRRMRRKFYDCSFDEVRAEIEKIVEITYRNYADSRKAPITVKAGPEFKDAGYDLSVEWLEARNRLVAAERVQKEPSSKTRILIVCASPRNDGTCPGEMSKSYRLAKIAVEVVKSTAGHEVEFLDLSRLTSEFGRKIHPCKGCVSTAMPLCHWPCSCYPNHSLDQVDDWMNEIYEMWVRAHGVMIISPVHWYQAPSALKLMMDRMVCADGGNADPTTTHGKKADEAKAIERRGWSFPKHLAGRAFAVVVHGDTTGVDGVRSALTDWMNDLELVAALPSSEVGRYIGYYEPYSDSHAALDRNRAVQDEVRKAAQALIEKVRLIRAGKNHDPKTQVTSVRSK